MATLSLSAFNGCCTTAVLDAAHGETCTDKDGRTVVCAKPQPAAYALMPLAVIGNTSTLPYWLAYTGNLGLIKNPM